MHISRIFKTVLPCSILISHVQAASIPTPPNSNITTGLDDDHEDLSTSIDAVGISKRVNANPGLPVSNPTTSFWHKSPPFPSLTHTQSSNLKNSTDIVIIGSGITGASIAFTILEECKAAGIERDIIMLEARDITSGATGRNGGHIKTAPYELYAEMKEKLKSHEKAKKNVDFQMMHLQVLNHLATEMKWDEVAESRLVDTVDLFFDQDTFDEARKQVDLLKENMPEHKMRVMGPKEAREEFATSKAVVGAISWSPAGALWPFRLVTSCLSYLAQNFPSFTIETNTPATNITITQDPIRPYLIYTPRGNISASQIIHATEAHSANLIPGLRGKIFPLRGHMTAQKQGKALSEKRARTIGSRSWSFNHENGFDYLTQRPISHEGNQDGWGAEYMLGGGLRLEPGSVAWDEIGVADDGSMNQKILASLNKTLPDVFGTDPWVGIPDYSRVKSAWTGIMGWSADGFPFVGKLSPSLTRRNVSGEYIAAGYSGEGMPQAWLSGAAVGMMALGRENLVSVGRPGLPAGKVRDWLPEELRISEERVKKADATVLLLGEADEN